MSFLHPLARDCLEDALAEDDAVSPSYAAVAAGTASADSAARATSHLDDLGFSDKVQDDMARARMAVDDAISSNSRLDVAAFKSLPAKFALLDRALLWQHGRLAAAIALEVQRSMSGATFHTWMTKRTQRHALFLKLELEHQHTVAAMTVTSSSRACGGADVYHGPVGGGRGNTGVGEGPPHLRMCMGTPLHDASITRVAADKERAINALLPNAGHDVIQTIALLAEQHKFKESVLLCTRVFGVTDPCVMAIVAKCCEQVQYKKLAAGLRIALPGCTNVYDALKIVLLHARRAKDDDAVSDFILLFDHVSSNTSRFLLAALALRKLHAERALQGMMEDYEFEDSIRQLVVWSKSKTMKDLKELGLDFEEYIELARHYQARVDNIDRRIGQVLTNQRFLLPQLAKTSDEDIDE